MATPNIDNVLRVPGRICASATDLATAYPHGGTGLGEVKLVSVAWVQQRFLITAEEFQNSEVNDIILSPPLPTISFLLREWDDDLLRHVFPNTSDPGTILITESGTERGGYLGSDQAIVLTFSPFDTTNHNFVVFHKAIPLLQEAASMRLALNEFTEMPIMFQPIRDHNNADKIFSIGKAGDITL